MPARTRTIPFLSGFTVKPASVSALGEVTFTDGINDVTPNQLQCEAYGYTYDKASGTCSAFRYNTNLNRTVANENNKTFGSNNSTQTGTNNTLVMGESNTVRGFSRNGSIIGNNNVIDNGVNNANVSGTLAEATATNSKVLGGNAGTDLLGERQAITLMCGIQTTDATVTNTNLNNTTSSFFTVPENTALMFDADVIGLRTGGTGRGSVGDYASFAEKGVVINKSGTLSIQSSTTALESDGTVAGWDTDSAVSGTNFILTVKGATDMIVEWSATIRFTQIKTTVAL